MAHIDFKITAWERVGIKEDYIEEVIAKIKSGEIQTSNDLMDYPEYMEDFNNGVVELVDGSQETIAVEENNGQYTIEIYEEFPADKIHYRNA